jgi:hypothetical protein
MKPSPELTSHVSQGPSVFATVRHFGHLAIGAFRREQVQALAISVLTTGILSAAGPG